MSLPTHAIDVDFQVTPQGQATGLLPQTEGEILAGAGDLIGSFGSEFPSLMVPQSKRQSLADKLWPQQRATIRQIYSQGRTSACVGFGAAQALEITRTRRYGGEHVPLSGMSVYKNIGRTLMSGAFISDGMTQIADEGVLPLDTPENRGRFGLTWGLLDWNGRFPSNWTATSKQFRVTRWAIARGADEIESAMLNNLCGIVGRDYHCVPYCGLTYDGGRSYVPYANSWGENWGDNGIGYDSERVYRNLSCYVAIEIAVDNETSVSLVTP